MKKPTCGNCIYRHGAECRFNPPNCTDDGEEVERWPYVRLSDWCGQHQDFLAFTNTSNFRKDESDEEVLQNKG